MPPDNDDEEREEIHETWTDRIMVLAARPTPLQYPAEHEGDEALVDVRTISVPWQGVDLDVKPGKKTYVYCPAKKGRNPDCERVPLEAGPHPAFLGVHWLKVLLRRVNPRRRQLVVAEVDLRKRAFPVEVLAMTRDAVHIMLRFEVLYQVAQSTNEKPATDILNVHDPLCQLHAFVTDAAFFAARTCTYADLLRSNGTNSDPLKKICCDVAERLKCCSTHIGLTVNRVLLEGIYPVTF